MDDDADPGSGEEGLMDAGQSLKAALADRYAIESEIDSGGMATVYRARDLRHERTVAIKVLRPDLAEAIGADRFLREIRTTANLSHPHILPLFDSGEADGFLFYVMPFVEGESLRDRLEREGQLPVEDAVQIARGVANALAYAHDKGVIHRDIKPANILLERGHALLADFGIAQAKAGADETRLTGIGMSLGTPAYMSPEQISGEGAVDGRSDQYALGCVLYEMLAGHPPFTGSDIQTVMRQHLAADAPRVTGARALVPSGVAKAIHRSLAKAPADRFRTVVEFEKALAGATLPFLARIPMGRARTLGFAAAFVLTFAVVPVFVFSRRGDEGPQLVPGRVLVMSFENRTGDPNLNELGDYAADFVGEAIAQLELAELFSLTYARQYADEAVKEGSADVLRAVAERTGAGLAVSGKIFGIGDSLQFRLEIIEVATGRSLQSVAESGPRELPEAAIGRLGQRVAGALAYELDPYMEIGAQTLPFPPLLEASRRHKLGYQAFDREDYEEALRQQLAAYEIDSTFVYALVAAGYAARQLMDDAMADSLARFADSRRHLLPRRGALDLDILMASMVNDRQAMLRAARENARIDPLGFSPLQHARSALAVNLPREAIQTLQTFDPFAEWQQDLSVGYWGFLCRAYHMLHDHEQELVEARRARNQHPDNPDMLILEIQAQAALDRLEEVDGLLDQVPGLSTDPFGAAKAAEVAGQELWAHGDPEAARATFERGIEWLRARPPGGADRGSHDAWLGRMLYRVGRWDEAHAIFLALAADQPEDLQFLGWLGTSATRTGDMASAREISARIAEMPRPEHAWEHFYVQACLTALLGQPDEAMRLLREALSHGMPYEMSLHREMDLESLWDRSDFQQLMRPRG